MDPPNSHDALGCARPYSGRVGLVSEQPKKFTWVLMRNTPEIDRNHSGASVWWALCLDWPASPLSAASLSVLSPLSQPLLQPLWKSRDKRGTNHNVPARTSSRERVPCVWQTEECIWAIWKIYIPFSVITLIGACACIFFQQYCLWLGCDCMLYGKKQPVWDSEHMLVSAILIAFMVPLHEAKGLFWA